MVTTVENKNAVMPGIYQGIPFAEYLKWPHLSQSTLKEGRTSMAHLKAAWDEERVTEPTDDMILGSALHVAFLEPEVMLERVAKWDSGTRRGKVWEAFCAEHEGKIILTECMYQHLQGMVRSLRRHPEVRRWLSRIDGVEVSCAGELEGVPFKGRVDALSDDPIVDLKKVRSNDPRMIRRQVYDLGYYLQGAIYTRLFKRDRFMLITVEDKPPYDVVAHEISPVYLGRGMDEAKELLAKVCECMRTGNWPGRSSQIETLDEPTWLSSDDEDKVHIS
jgi:hypothetical protein